MQTMLSWRVEGLAHRASVPTAPAWASSVIHCMTPVEGALAVDAIIVD